MTVNVGRLYVCLGLMLLLLGCNRAAVIPTPLPQTATPTPKPSPTLRPTVTPVPTEAAPTKSPTATAVLPTIAERLNEDIRFSTFLNAFQQTNLEDALGDPGPFTLFVPTNDAFATLPPGVLDNFLAAPKGDLSDLMLYHVVNGRLSLETLATLPTVSTALKEDITIQQLDSGGIQLNQRVAVTDPDIQARNGVIHLVDSVLIPASSLASIAEIASNDAQFTTFLAALEAADLVNVLGREGPYTIFVPSDDAFASLPPGALASLLADPNGALTDALFAHVIEGQVSLQDLAQLAEVTNVTGGVLSVSRANGSIVLGENIQFTKNDILASNGVVHVVDSVLLPTLPTIAELLQLDGRFSQLVAALEAADLLDELNEPGAHTLFAPTNDAFAGLPAELQAFWETADQTQADNILRFHVVESLLSNDDLAAAEQLTTQTGVKLIVEKTADSFRLNDEAMLTDIIYLASNGIIRGIDRVLLPPQEPAN